MTIFVDMDDVLADTYGRHVELYNQEHNAALSIANIEHGEVWQNVPEQHIESIHKHVRAPRFFRDLEPIEDSQEVMKALWDQHEVYIATAATQFPNSLKEKSEWLAEHFPFITWQHQIMCGHKFILNGDLLIDDRSYNLDLFKGDTLLFNSPHNFKDVGYDRVGSWKEIAERLL